MNVVADFALIAWPIGILALFCWSPTHRASAAAFVAGWLFLPMHGFAVPLFPDYTKMSATCVGVLGGLLVFDSPALRSFRISVLDMPMVVLCICPLASSLSNGLGIGDGISSVLSQSISFGVPYFIGRLTFRTAEGILDLAYAIFVGGMIYIPFCAFELRMSPQLHTMVYGAHQHSFAQSFRFGGWRPTVFMEHGLMVAAWMATASLCGVCLWCTKELKHIAGIPAGILVVALLITTILCKSTGALLLLAVGIGTFYVSYKLRTIVPLWLLAAIAPTYAVVRMCGAWDGAEAVSWARSISDERAESLQFRISNEDILLAKALERPVFGWGGWGRSRVFDDYGKDISVTDGYWIIEYGTHGIVGLVSFMAAMLIPALTVAKRLSSKHPPRFLGATYTLVASVLLFSVDCIPNAMLNPIFMLINGALVNLALLRESASLSLPQTQPIVLARAFRERVVA